MSLLYDFENHYTRTILSMLMYIKRSAIEIKKFDLYIFSGI